MWLRIGISGRKLWVRWRNVGLWTMREIALDGWETNSLSSKILLYEVTYVASLPWFLHVKPISHLLTLSLSNIRQTLKPPLYPVFFSLQSFLNSHVPVIPFKLLSSSSLRTSLGLHCQYYKFSFFLHKTREDISFMAMIHIQQGNGWSTTDFLML